NEHGAALMVGRTGGKHALRKPDIAAQLGKLVDRADKHPDIRAVVFTGAHPDRFLSHADVAWLQEGGVGFPPINTRVAGIVSRMARVIRIEVGASPSYRLSLAGLLERARIA